MMVVSSHRQYMRGTGTGVSASACMTRYSRSTWCALGSTTMNAEAETQVYVVFPNAHLMLRDQRAFRESFDCANL